MLAERVQKAKAAAQFTKVLSRDRQGRPNSLLVPGSEGKQYEVILRRAHGQFSGECRLVIGNQGYQDCPGNSNNHVCYHVLAAVLAVAAETNHPVKVCKSKADATKVARMGGMVVTVVSHQSDGALFAVVQ